MVSVDASASAAQPAARRVVVSYVSSAHLLADHQGQAQKEAEEEKGVAVEGGVQDDEVVYATDTEDSNVHSDLEDEVSESGRSCSAGGHVASIRYAHYEFVTEVVCTPGNCTHTTSMRSMMLCILVVPSYCLSALFACLSQLLQ